MVVSDIRFANLSVSAWVSLLQLQLCTFARAIKFLLYRSYSFDNFIAAVLVEVPQWCRSPLRQEVERSYVLGKFTMAGGYDLVDFSSNAIGKGGP